MSVIVQSKFRPSSTNRFRLTNKEPKTATQLSAAQHNGLVHVFFRDAPTTFPSVFIMYVQIVKNCTHYSTDSNLSKYAGKNTDTQCHS